MLPLKTENREFACPAQQEKEASPQQQTRPPRKETVATSAIVVDREAFPFGIIFR